MEIVIRQAALCVFRRGREFLVAENTDPHDAANVINRPPGGGIEEGETPEAAVRRELMEELGIELTEVTLLGSIDHVWIWKSRALHERAFIFTADLSDDPRLARGELPELLEADGIRSPTVWRSLNLDDGVYPPLCPPGIRELLEGCV